jgi:hypothetical protein
VDALLDPSLRREALAERPDVGGQAFATLQADFTRPSIGFVFRRSPVRLRRVPLRFLFCVKPLRRGPLHPCACGQRPCVP